MMTNTKGWMVWAGWLLFAMTIGGCGGDSAPLVPAPSPSASLYSCGNFGGTAESSPLLKVANGEGCAPTDSSPVVSLQMTDSAGNGYLCSGTVISPKKVLTAAHCVKDYVSIVVRYATSTSSSRYIAAADWTYHPQYTGTAVKTARELLYDVGVVTLSSEIPVPKMPVLVSVPPTVGSDVTVYGFGDTDSAGPVNVLRYGTMTISEVTNELILALYSGATSSLSNTCHGDSGGPIIRAQGTLRGVVGVTSAGSTSICGDSDESTFTKLYNQSIQDFLKTNAMDASYI